MMTVKEELALIEEENALYRQRIREWRKRMTEQEYNEHEGIRRSDLWLMKRSPAHYRYAAEHPAEPSPAMIFGIAAHTAVLTPGEWHKQFEICNWDLRTKEGKAAKQAAQEAGKTLISAADTEKVQAIAETLISNPFTARLLAGDHENPCFWTDEMTGEKCKCRTDCETEIGGENFIVDLKTCGDASTEAFMRDAVKYGYHVQAAMYREGVKAATGNDCKFVFIAVEKEAPFAVNILQCDDGFLLRGMDEYRYLLGLYHECKTADRWPSYEGLAGEVNMLELPAWLKKEVE